MRGTDEKEDAGLEVREGRDRLHLDGVSGVEGVVEESGSVDDLPPDEVVVRVSDEERLRGEGVGLHLA